MKLIEKKCPNCGGSLEFSETAKSCKCEYCHRAFEIERDEKLDVNNIAEQFNLSELQAPLKVAKKAFIGSYIVAGIIGIIGIVMFIIIGSQILGAFTGGSLYTDVAQFNNEDYGDFDKYQNFEKKMPMVDKMYNNFFDCYTTKNDDLVKDI